MQATSVLAPVILLSVAVLVSIGMPSIGVLVPVVVVLHSIRVLVVFVRGYWYWHGRSRLAHVLHGQHGCPGSDGNGTVRVVPFHFSRGSWREGMVPHFSLVRASSSRVVVVGSG